MLNTSVQVLCGDLRLHALGINLSDVGMCLFTVANLELGSQIIVEFIPPRGNQHVRMQGMVRHRALYLYGVEFRGSCDELTETLRAVDPFDTQDLRTSVPDDRRM